MSQLKGQRLFQEMYAMQIRHMIISLSETMAEYAGDFAMNIKGHICVSRTLSQGLVKIKIDLIYNLFEFTKSIIATTVGFNTSDNNELPKWVKPKQYIS